MLAQVDPRLVLSPASRWISCVIVGIGGWTEYTLPAVRSILKHEPECDVVLVDAGSKRAYHTEPDYPDGIRGIRLVESFSYAGAINIGVAAADAEWTLILNNDTLCTGPFADLLTGLSRSCVYGRQIIEERGERWIGLWIMAISRECREATGQFDEAFRVCGFEDLDFCLRAKQAGFSSKWADFPFEHLWGRTRWGVPDYPKIREDNRRYFEKKWGWMPGIAMRVVRE
jgi:GT2 family glycosyltransferase